MKDSVQRGLDSIVVVLGLTAAYRVLVKLPKNPSTDEALAMLHSLLHEWTQTNYARIQDTLKDQTTTSQDLRMLCGLNNTAEAQLIQLRDTLEPKENVNDKNSN